MRSQFLGFGAQDQVDIRVGQRAFPQRTVALVKGKFHRKPACFCFVDQPWRYIAFDVIRQRNVEHPRGRFGGKLRAFVDDGGHCGEGLSDFRRNLQRPSGWHHAGAGTDEQLVVKLFAQALERRADRPLRDMQHRCCTGHAALVHQALKNDEQVEVDPADISNANYGHLLYSFV